MTRAGFHLKQFIVLVSIMAAPWSLSMPNASAEGESGETLGSQGRTLPTPRSVFDRHISAIGGEAAIRHHRYRRMIARFEIPSQNLTSEMDLFAAAPNKLLSKLRLTGVGEVSRGFDGQIGWLIQPGVGAMRLAGPMLLAIQDEASFYRDLYLSDDMPTARVLGIAEFAEKRAYEVRVTRRAGESTEYFDLDTGLLLGTVALQIGPSGQIETKTVLAEYREFGGVRYPTHLSVWAGPVKTIVTVTAISHERLDDAVFAVPASIPRTR